MAWWAWLLIGSAAGLAAGFVVVFVGVAWWATRGHGWWL